MAKSDFICAKCKKVSSKGFMRISSFNKYSCPNCGTLCEDCVKTGMLSSTKCKSCGEKVIRYTWNGNKDKWERS